VYAAVIGHWWGIDVQFHFNKSDSLYIAAIGPAAAGAWLFSVFGEIDPPYAALLAGAVAAASVYNTKQVEKNNCIGVNIDDGIPKFGFYRSKHECG
jgi:hypothetical protein